MVPKRGLEPPHPDGYYTLNVARLPIPPLRPVRLRLGMPAGTALAQEEIRRRFFILPSRCVAVKDTRRAVDANARDREIASVICAFACRLPAKPLCSNRHEVACAERGRCVVEDAKT